MLENHGKSRGKPWEKDGNMLENYGKTMEAHGKTDDPVDFGKQTYMNHFKRYQRMRSSHLNMI